MSLENKLDTIFNLYLQHGNEDYIGESLSQTNHMIQAAMLAEDELQGPEIVLAALFHDIGQLVKKTEQIGNFGNKNHEKIGYDFLINTGFTYPIPDLVFNHVKAKRYLTYKYPEYQSNLTLASQQTLLAQGGPMTQFEAEEFESDPLFQNSLKIRNYDDNAKDPDKIVKDINYFRTLCYNFMVQSELSS
ncbi:hypothetical protein CPAV1605_64 [seawater metagenome]|uniref:HD domain-containing protein n=1 Tax=seawater metagenome TaxID=1561972 RepID=A0A5E8CL38_9ZZZZ